VVEDVVEVTHLLLGTIIKTPDLYQEIFMEIPLNVLHIHYHHVLITYILPNTQIAQPPNTQPHLVKKPVKLPLDYPGLPIYITEHLLTPSLESQTSKKNS